MWIALSVSARAATWTIPVDLPTIADAVANAESGDVIRLLPGVYVESINVTGISLTFEGEPGVVWVANGNEMLDCEYSADCIVRDIQFDGLRQFHAIEVEDDSTLEVERCRFVHGSEVEGGAIYASFATRLVIRDSAFYDNSASTSGGHVYVTDTEVAEISRSTFVGGVADLDAGAVRITSSGEALLSDLWLVSNSAQDDGGAVDIDATSFVDVRRSFFCANSTVDEGGALVVRDAQTVLAGNIFLNNSTETEGGALFQNGGQLETRHTHFVANQAAAGGAAVWSSADHISTDDLYAWNEGSVAHYDPSPTLSYGLFWSNPDGDAEVDLPPTILKSDPLLTADPPFGCAPSLLVPLLGSPMLGAGAPTIGDADTSEDIGAFDGPDAYNLDLVPVDADGDSIDSSMDCDDEQAAVSPGLAEIDCDGLDNDCDAATPDIQDKDGDGFTSCEDCDDSLGDVFPGQLELPADWIDQDCDGTEYCFADEDADGRGEDTLIQSDDLDCEDLGEAVVADDLCPGFDDGLDVDADGVPDGCDPLIDEPPETDTGAGGTSTVGPDPLVDSDGDGIPDSIDPFPEDAGGELVIAPEPEMGCGCSASPRAGGWLPGMGLGWGLLGLAFWRRRG